MDRTYEERVKRQQRGSTELSHSPNYLRNGFYNQIEYDEESTNLLDGQVEKDEDHYNSPAEDELFDRKTAEGGSQHQYLNRKENHNNADGQFQCVITQSYSFIEKQNESEQVAGQLIMVGIICMIFMAVEFVGGYLSNSSAIMTDAAHMLSDVMAMAVSVFSIKMGSRAPNLYKTFGYHRAEVLGALTSILIIWVLVAWLCYEASQRMYAVIYKNGFPLDPAIMLITSFVSLVCNILNLFFLGMCSGDGHGIIDNVHSVFKPHGQHAHEHGPDGSCSHGHGHGHHGHGHHHHGHGHHHGHDHGHKCSGHQHQHHDHDKEHGNHQHDHEHHHDHGHDHHDHGQHHHDHGHHHHQHDHGQHQHDHGHHHHDHGQHHQLDHDHSPHDHDHSHHDDHDHGKQKQSNSNSQDQGRVNTDPSQKKGDQQIQETSFMTNHVHIRCVNPNHDHNAAQHDHGFVRTSRENEFKKKKKKHASPHFRKKQGTFSELTVSDNENNIEQKDFVEDGEDNLIQNKEINSPKSDNAPAVRFQRNLSSIDHYAQSTTTLSNMIDSSRQFDAKVVECCFKSCRCAKGNCCEHTECEIGHCCDKNCYLNAPGIIRQRAPGVKNLNLRQVKSEIPVKAPISPTNKSDNSRISHNAPSLKSTQSQNLNIRSAVVHAVGDLIQSVGVIIAAAVIYYRPNYQIADPICTYVFSVIVMFTTVPVFWDCYEILMEFPPKDLDMKQCKNDLQNIKGIQSVEDFHVWSLGGGKVCMTAYLRLEEKTGATSDNRSRTLTNFTSAAAVVDSSFVERQRIYNMVQEITEKHDICHSTIQLI